MAYDIDSLKKGKNAPGRTKETADQEVADAGVWKHPDSGHEVITKAHPLFGNAQSEGFARLGYVRVRDVQEGEVKTIVEQVLDQRTSEERSIKSLEKRLQSVEADSKLADADRAELEQLRAEKSDREKAASTPSDGALDTSADTAKENGVEQGEKQADEAKRAEKQLPLRNAKTVEPVTQANKKEQGKK